MANILVVDDSSVMRQIVTNMITKNTVHTVIGEAGDGEEAYRQYKKLHPDLVTMDITMPVLDGIGAVRKIRAEFPNALIIMISAVGDRDNIVDCIKEGATNFILKPVNGEKVRETIAKVLEEDKNNR